MENHALITNMLLTAWNTHTKRASSIFDSHSDEAIMMEIAPGKNRVVYLLGHLVAVHDGMLSLLGLGEREYAHLDEAFLKNPDKAVENIPSVAELRTAWNQTHESLATHFAALTPTEWLAKHTAVSEEDFAKEPHRNRLNVLISRTNHLQYHTGQIALLKN